MKLLSNLNITTVDIIYKSSLYATRWTFGKNNFDLLRRYIGYIIKSTPYKNKTLIGVIYFYRFLAYY